LAILAGIAMTSFFATFDSSILLNLRQFSFSSFFPRLWKAFSSSSLIVIIRGIENNFHCLRDTMIIWGSSLVNSKNGELLKTNRHSLIPRLSLPPRIEYGVNSGGIPAQKHWISPYQVRGRLCQARNDN
jgi:hypothetical protein